MRIGNRLGEYTLIEKLGEGGFGEVWRAEDPDRLGAFVAVKVAKEGASASSLGREGMAQQALCHPNVVRTLSSHLRHDPPYLVNEWVPGESLRQRLEQARRLWVGEALRIVRLVLRGLGVAHAVGIVHRDVKPANVLLGPGGAVKLTDFGLGRAGGGSASSIALSHGASMSLAGGVVGTFLYMSPEQLDGQTGDHRSDLYACGVMLYEMLTGSTHPVRLPVRGAPSRLSEAIDCALAVDPDDRFQSAAEMLAALDEAEDESYPWPVRSAPVRSARVPRESRTGLVVWTFIAAGAMVLFYAMIFATALWDHLA